MPPTTTRGTWHNRLWISKPRKTYVSWSPVIGPHAARPRPMTGRHLFAGATLKSSFSSSSRFSFSWYFPGQQQVAWGRRTMKVLGVAAVVVALYCAHAKVYLREEFLDGGEFPVWMCSTLAGSELIQNPVLNSSHFTCKLYIGFYIEVFLCSRNRV